MSERKGEKEKRRVSPGGHVELDRSVDRVVVHPPVEADWDRVAETLLGCVEDLVRGGGAETTADRPPGRILHRFTVQTGPGDPLSWLRRQRTGVRLYWSPRDGGQETAGAGVADEIHVPGGPSFGALRHALTERFRHGNQSVRYFGGLRFDDAQSPSAEWRSFGSCRFVLPRLACIGLDGACRLELNVVVSAGWVDVARVREEILSADFRRPIPFAVDIPDALGRANAPDEAGWSRNVRRVLSDFSRSRLSKVVLARRASFELSGPLDGADLLALLQRDTPGCYQFLYQFESGAAFVGVSPERLLRVVGDRIWSEAVAGTRPRADTMPRDDELARELLASEKEQREHQFVRQTVKEQLSEVCEVLLVDAQASEMKLTRGRHLVSRFRGSLRPDVGRVRLIEMLHPTPAVGGHPTGDAVGVIDALEPFDRGWYAAPVGWVGPDRMEFAVGIRSALAMGRHLHVYSGAGIVAGSDAHREWLEIENKIEDYSTVISFVDAGSEHQ